MPIQVLQRQLWDGVPRDLGEWWTLRKSGHEAICRMFAHPLGWELRLEVDREMSRTAVCRSHDEVFNTEEDWKKAWQAKGRS